MKFEDWYTKFIKDNRKDRELLDPIRFKSDVVKSKKEIRERLGGKVKTIVFNEDKPSKGGNPETIYYKLIIDTQPSAFIKIGHYGADKYSCWKQGGCHNNRKYIFALQKDTFVLNLYEVNKEGNKHLGRMLGFYKNGVVNIYNFYGLPRGECDYTSMIERAINYYFFSNKGLIKQHEMYVNGGGLYINSDRRSMGLEILNGDTTLNCDPYNYNHYDYLFKSLIKD